MILIINTWWVGTFIIFLNMTYRQGTQNQPGRTCMRTVSEQTSNSSKSHSLISWGQILFPLKSKEVLLLISMGTGFDIWRGKNKTTQARAMLLISQVPKAADPCEKVSRHLIFVHCKAREKSAINEARTVSVPYPTHKSICKGSRNMKAPDYLEVLSPLVRTLPLVYVHCPEAGAGKKQNGDVSRAF